MTAIPSTPWQAFFEPDEIDPSTGKLFDHLPVGHDITLCPPAWVDDAEDEEAPTARPVPTRENPAPTDYSEMVPGETELTARDYARARHSDLSLEEQMSQFLATPWDEEPYDDPEYLELELACDMAKARRWEEQIQANIAQYRLEHPEALPEA